MLHKKELQIKVVINLIYLEKRQSKCGVECCAIWLDAKCLIFDPKKLVKKGHRTGQDEGYAPYQKKQIHCPFL